MSGRRGRIEKQDITEHAMNEGVDIELIGYIIYYAIPYADLDILGLLAAIPILGLPFRLLPLVKPIPLKVLINPAKLFLLITMIVVPYFDLEGVKGLRKLGLSGLEGLDLTADNNKGGKTNGRVMTDRGVPQQGTHSLGGILKVAGLLVVGLFALFTVFGSGYGSLAEQAVGNQVIGLDIEDEILAAQQAFQQAKCMGNAACMRAWQFNNTQRPGSEAVGQEYQLDIDGFEVNDGRSVDVAGRQPKYNLPITFSVYNPRHGLKGIPAKNAQYRVKVQKPEGLAGLRGSETLCSTGWRPLNGQYAESYGGDSGTLFPGDFATPQGTLQDLNLSSCGLMQPALGMTRHVVMNVKYEYSSQSQVYFDAKARDAVEETPGFEESETADTPVKTYVNVESPATFSGDERRPNVFLVQVGFETAQSGMKYKVHPDELVLTDSTNTVDVENVPEDSYSSRFDFGNSNCLGLDNVGENTYTLSGDQKKYLRGRIDDGWFESGEAPSPATCAMVIEDPTQISPSGETMRMSVDANYTIMLEESVTNFEVRNTHCSGSSERNCPFVIPKDIVDEAEEGDGYLNGVETDHLVTKCDDSIRVDASNGCDVRNGSNWRAVPGPFNTPEVDGDIDNGEIAYTWDYFDREYDGGGYLKNSPEETDTAIGITESEKSALDAAEDDDEGYSLVNIERGSEYDVEGREIEATLCTGAPADLDYSADREDFRNAWSQRNSDVSEDKILLFNPKVSDCDAESGFWESLASSILGGKTKEEVFQEEVDKCTEGGEQIGVIVKDNSNLRCWEYSD